MGVSNALRGVSPTVVVGGKSDRYMGVSNAYNGGN